MTGYRVRRAAPHSCDEWYDAPLVPHLIVNDHEPIFTGLVDGDGNEIWRDPEPIGFHNPLDS